MRTIPSYALYGEPDARAPLDVLHCESIPSRSRLHGWEIDPHRHEYFLQILYIRSGTGAAWLNHRQVVLTSPSVVVVPATHPHGFQFQPEIDGYVVTTHQETVAASVLAAFPMPTKLALTSGANVHRHIETTFDTLVSTYTSSEPWREEVLKATLVLLLGHIARARASDLGPSPVESRAQRHMRRFQQLLDKNFRQERNIEFYAECLGVTPTQLNRICRSQLGMSALSVIHRRLMAEAERDLAYTTFSVKAIAYSLGFSDAAYFSRFFRRRRGMTPSEFRIAMHRRFAQAQPLPTPFQPNPPGENKSHSLSSPWDSHALDLSPTSGGIVAVR